MKRRTVAPTETIVTLDEAKAQCVVDHSDDDTLLTRLVAAASDYLDGPDAVTGRALVTQTWQIDLPPVSGRGAIDIPVAPLIAVTAVSYYDRDNQSQSLTVGGEVRVYSDTDTAYITPDFNQAWPAMYQRPDALRITITAGYGAAEAVPENIRHAALALIAHWYEHRDAVNIGNITSEVPMLVNALLNKDRLGWLGG